MVVYLRSLHIRSDLLSLNHLRLRWRDQADILGEPYPEDLHDRF